MLPYAVPGGRLSARSKTRAIPDGNRVTIIWLIAGSVTSVIVRYSSRDVILSLVSNAVSLTIRAARHKIRELDDSGRDVYGLFQLDERVVGV